MCALPLNRKMTPKPIKNGKGIQYILNEAYKILENPVALHDLDNYRLIASTEGITTDDPFFNELIAKGAFSDEIMAFSKDACWFDAVANGDIVSLVSSDNLKYDRALGKVYNVDNIIVAALVVVACNRSFSDKDFEQIESICKTLTKEIKNSEQFHSMGHSFQESLVKSLIEGSIQDKGFFSPYVANIYEGLKNNIYLAVADIYRCDPEYTQISHFRELLTKAQKHYKYFIYSNYILIILSADDESLAASRDFKKLLMFLKANKITAGVSSGFDNLYNIGRYYGEAVEALSRGKESGSDELLFYYDKTGAT